MAARNRAFSLGKLLGGLAFVFTVTLLAVLLIVVSASIPPLIDHTVQDQPSHHSNTQPVITTPSKGSITFKQYEKIETGMTVEEVGDLMGDKGKEMQRTESDGISITCYSWVKWSGANVTAIFENTKLISKGQLGL